MTSATAPIDPARFALALESLPLDTLHAKAAELRNSISHLKSSNEQMLPFAEEGDDVCREAMFENLSVIGRINERISLLRAEVEKRGMRWAEGEVEDAEMRDKEVGGGMVNEDGETVVNGMNGEGVNGVGVNGVTGVTGVNGVGRREQSGRLTDEDLRRRLEAQMEGEDEEGVHL